jgi:hypothetical protein
MTLLKRKYELMKERLRSQKPEPRKEQERDRIVYKD